MAIAAVKVTLGQSLGNGNYSTSSGGATAPDLATIFTDITTALGEAGSSFDSTDDLNTIQADATALVGSITGDVVVMWDGAVVTTRTQLRAALKAALDAANAGYGALTE